MKGTAWAPACLEPDELDDYRAGALTGCRDCTVAFSADMTALNRCNGIPGEVTSGLAQEEPMDQPEPAAARGRSTTHRMELEVAAPPCASCSHEPVCVLRLAVEGMATVETVALPLPAGLRLTLVATVECEHFLRDRAKPAPVRVLSLDAKKAFEARKVAVQREIERQLRASGLHPLVLELLRKAIDTYGAASGCSPDQDVAGAVALAIVQTWRVRESITPELLAELGLEATA